MEIVYKFVCKEEKVKAILYIIWGYKVTLSRQLNRIYQTIEKGFNKESYYVAAGCVVG